MEGKVRQGKDQGYMDYPRDYPNEYDPSNNPEGNRRPGFERGTRRSDWLTRVITNLGDDASRNQRRPLR